MRSISGWFSAISLLSVRFQFWSEWRTPMAMRNDINAPGLLKERHHGQVRFGVLREIADEWTPLHPAVDPASDNIADHFPHWRIDADIDGERTGLGIGNQALRP